MLFIPSGDLNLEARLEPGDRAAAALLCHPHPRYGGDMESVVVVALQRRLAAAGLTTLRFNTRGVGASTGEVSGDTNEANDVLACLDFLRGSLTPPAERIWVIGYSYGAWIGRIAAMEDGGAAGLVLIAPPVELLPFEEEEDGDPVEFAGPMLVVVGDRDEYAPEASVRAFFDEATAEVLPGCDHFFWGFEARAADLAADFIAKDAGS